MKIGRIQIQQYRNITQADFYPSDGLTVIAGKNGQGKTNLLEAIWCLTGAKSFRGAKDLELVQEGADFAAVAGDIQSAQKESHVRVTIAGEGQTPKGRRASVNGVDYGRATNLAGTLLAVVFEPNHLSLIKGGPEGRRRFIDASMCQLYPSYLEILRRYTRLVKQKNSLLKQYYQTPNAEMMMDAFDDGLVTEGVQISARRAEYVHLLFDEVTHFYSDITSGTEQIILQYTPSMTPENARGVLRDSRARDILAGFCTQGPHREDFYAEINGRAAKSFASQGQQRSAVLSLKLAEAACAQRITGEAPVMLLDDVLSELDDTRQSYLLNRMKKNQTIVTACNAALFKEASGKVFRMVNGAAEEM